MDKELMPTIKKAVDFHGHLGPFVVMGIRMSLTGVRRLGVKGNDEKLRVTAMLKDSVPFSCVIDGIQVATKCTIGNKKLRLKSSSGIAAKFELPSREQVTVSINPATFETLKNELLSQKVPPKGVQKLAQLVASMPEEELFIIRKK